MQFFSFFCQEIFSKNFDILCSNSRGCKKIFLTCLTGYDNLTKCPIVGNYGLKEVADLRVAVTMACTECKRRNYMTTKNKKTTPDRLEMKKYCSFCKTHTLHKETK